MLPGLYLYGYSSITEKRHVGQEGEADEADGESLFPFAIGGV